MKIAISSQGTNLNARVAQRLGISPYVFIVDSETMKAEAIPISRTGGVNTAGMHAVVIAVSNKVDTVLTGYCSPTAAKYLADNGIRVVTGIKGTVAEALAQYKRHGHNIEFSNQAEPVSTSAVLRQALKSSGKQLINLLPVLFGVVLLIGLFNSLISRDLLLKIFSGNALLDTLFGTGFGSILAGNPINSYVIGGEMLEKGVSLFAVTAFITAWVTIGLVQLPAEMTALGNKFGLIRNALSIVLCVAISFMTVGTFYAISGWNH